MVGQKGTLVDPCRTHSMIIRDLRKELWTENSKFKKSNRKLSKKDYANFLLELEHEFKLLEEAAEEIRTLELRLVGSLNNVEKKLRDYKGKIKHHQHPKFHDYRDNIEKLLQRIRNIAHEIDRGTHISIREEGYIHAHAKR